MNDRFARSVYAMYLGGYLRFSKIDQFPKTFLTREYSAVIAKTLFGTMYSKLDEVKFVIHRLKIWK